MIRSATLEDAKAISEIYNHYILNSISTFELEPIDADELANRIKALIPKYPWLVYEKAGILGYAYACPWKGREAYNRSAETSVYVRHDSFGKGIGRELYAEIVRLMKAKEAHALMGGISLPNEASEKLHESLGYKKVAHFSEVGYKFDKWIDVGYWQLIL